MTKITNVLSLILGLIGGVMLCIGGFLIIISSEIYRINLANLGYTYADIHIDPSLFGIAFIITIIWGIFSILLSLVSFMLKKRGLKVFRLFFGTLIIVGIFAIIGSSIVIKPLEYVDLGGGYFIWAPPIKLSTTLILIDPILVIIAGVIGAVTKP